MTKDIRPYLHLYLGCKCLRMGYKNQAFTLTGISYNGTQNIWWAYFEDEEDCYSQIDDVFPILRRLSSMTLEEDREVGRICREVMRKENAYVDESVGAKAMHLLSKGFDLFGLIDSELAIDADTLK